jgi:hypothetical protein
MSSIPGSTAGILNSSTDVAGAAADAREAARSATAIAPTVMVFITHSIASAGTGLYFEF